MRRRRRRSSPALPAPLPENDDLLREIILHLPELPSSLLRASLVCTRWCRILSDPQFLRRFGAFHRRQAPLLGLFICDVPGNFDFSPMLDPPDRIPSARFSMPLPSHEMWSLMWSLLDRRHGLVLNRNMEGQEIIVWGPDTGAKGERRLPLPPAFKDMGFRHGAVLCDDHASWPPLESFKVVLCCTRCSVLPGAQHRAFALIYESRDNEWSNIISTPIETTLHVDGFPTLAGNSFYWLLGGRFLGYYGILKFDLDRKNLAVMDTPAGAKQVAQERKAQILRMEDSRLGVALVTEFSIQVWERKPDSEGGAEWIIQNHQSRHAPFTGTCVAYTLNSDSRV